jgi:hypothetical protein
LKIKSFGCSFIFGSELPDIATGDFRPSDLTWPAVLARRQQWQYECHAWPGRGNLYIADRVLEQVQLSDKHTVFIINWTWVDRFDYFSAVDDAWQSILPQDRGSIPDHYHRHLHSQKRDKLVSLMYIYSCMQALHNNSIPYVMTYMDHILDETRWHSDAAIAALQDSVLPRLQDFDGSNFLDWSRSHGYAVSDLWHPLQAAHAAAADFMLPRIQRVLSR